MTPIIYSQFVTFLRDEMNLPADSIAVARRSVAQNTEFMPMALWQYGLINIDQLDRIYDWLESC